MYEHNKRNEKKLRRKENKKKKLKALLEISSLNDQDRKKSSRKNSASSDLSGTVPIENGHQTLDEPNPKRMKRDFLFPLNGQENSNEVRIKKERTELTEEQTAQLKKLLKLRRKTRHERPYLELNEIGEAASISLKKSQRVPLPFDDFQHFIIASLFAHMATKGPSRWINCKKPQKLERRIFMIIEGAGIKEFMENRGDLETLSQFEKQLEVISPIKYGGDLINELALVSMTGSQRRKLALEYGSLKEAYNSGDIFNALKTLFPINDKSSSSAEEINPEKVKTEKKEMKMNVTNQEMFSRIELLLTPWELIVENFPVSCEGKDNADFVYTCDSYSVVSHNSPMWALDCEMCLTAYGNELTRVCIVDEDCNIVYETLVKPKSPILNYLTRYSGITPEMMKRVKTRLEDVQRDIRAICPTDLILIGHSLQNDLNALKMIHPYVIDTSVIFNMSGLRHRKTKLRILVEEFLSMRIQVNEKLGHSPVEDAVAAMKLVQAKLNHSVSWGNSLLCGPRCERESAAARMLLESRDAAGLAHMPTENCQRLVWPQLMNRRDEAGLAQQFSSKKSNWNAPHLECVSSTPLFSHLVRYNRNAALVAKKSDLDRWAPYCNVSNERFHVEEVQTSRAAVRYVQEHTPLDGTSIAYVTLNPQEPVKAIMKADRLTQKLMKHTRGNTLYSVLLAGSPQNPGNGLMCIHLARQAVPLVPDFYTF